MVILPAIDLLEGRVVRLAQGRRDQVTVYDPDPVAVARRWAASGARWLHIVDLDGAFDGVYRNLPAAQRVIAACPDVSVELSGGIRTEEALARAMEAGAARVVLGTKACEDPPFIEAAVRRYGDRIAVALDAKAGRVVSRGWVASTALAPAELAGRVAGFGVRTLICTDVSRDGMLQGPNLALLREVLHAVSCRVIASGGIASLADLQRLKQLEPRGVIGAIIGKALYEGAVDLAAAIRAVA